MIAQLRITTNGKGLHDFTDQVHQQVARTEVTEGLCTGFGRHTSCSLIIQENADPSARRDLERWLDRHVQEGDALYTHTSEGPDDMPAHIKVALTQTSIGIPILDGRLALGTWQGIYLWEHRAHPHERRIVLHIA